MNSAHRWDCILKGVCWMAGGVEMVLLTAVALAFFGKLLLVQGSVPYALLSLYAANWLFVLGFISVPLAAVWLLIRAKSICRAPDLEPIRNNSSPSNIAYIRHVECFSSGRSTSTSLFGKHIERHALWDR